MPHIFDNIENSLSDALRIALEKAERADFCVGYFNLRGWGRISDLVANRFDGKDDHCVRVLAGMHRPPEEEMRILQSALRQDTGIDGPTLARLRLRAAENFKQQIEFGLPSNEAERSLQELAHQIRDNLVKVKLFLRYPLHAKLYLVHRSDPVTPVVGYIGSSNLTQAGLSGQGELNVDVVEQDAADKLQGWFNNRWIDDAAFDISDELLHLIEASWARDELVPPYLVYLKILYHLSEDSRKGDKEIKLPEEFRGVLLDFQVEAVKLAAKHIYRRGGVLLGDVVGLGKTMMASAIAKTFEEDRRRGRTLVICPPKLIPMWKGYVQRYNLQADVESLGNVINGLADLKGRYKFLIIDESHNLRNREGRRYQAIRDFIDEHEPLCLLLTATPYNKLYADISNQLRLFWDENNELGIRPEQFFRKWVEQGKNEADFRANYQTSPRSLRAFEQSDSPDDWRNLLRRFMVRRTRNFIKTFYAKFDNTIKRHYVLLNGEPKYFPLRDPENLTFDLNEDNPNDQYARLYRDDVVQVIEKMNLPRYGLANYLSPESEKALKLSNDEKRIINNLNRAGRRLIGFSRTNLFKRLESSGYSFLLSIQRHILRNLVTLYALETSQPVPIGTQDVTALDTAILDTQAEWIPDDDPTTEEVDIEDTLIPTQRDPIDNYRIQAEKVYQIYRNGYLTRFDWLNPRVFDSNLSNHLIEDAEALMNLVITVGEWDPIRDAKLDRLYTLLTEDHPNDKVLVFTQFADTADYIARELHDRGLDDLDVVTAQSPNPTSIVGRFSPKNNEYKLKTSESELRVLIATDILAEGQNLQDCAIVVNYDLPWAIIRLIQRAGRIDRIGQNASTILVYSFWTADGVEYVIRLRERLTQRLCKNQEVVGTDESFFGEASAEKLRDLYTEKSSVLDDDAGEDVDLDSEAYALWRNASEDARRQAEKLPPVVFATRPHIATDDNPDGLLVYLKFPSGDDGLVRVDDQGNVVSQSITGILHTAQCGPEEPALTRRTDHHELTAHAVNKAIAEVSDLGGQLGSLRSTSRKVYERLDVYKQRLQTAGQETIEIDKVLDAMFRYHLTEKAREALGRELRFGIPDEALAEMVATWYEDDRLVEVADENEPAEPAIICSMGLRDANA